MSEDTDPTLDLVEVSERFLAAEEELKSLAAAAQTLTTEANQLGDAQRSLGEVAEAVAELVSTLEGLVEDIQLSTQAIQQTDPAAVLRRLDAIDGVLVQSGTAQELAADRLEEVRSALTAEAERAAADSVELRRLVERNRIMIMVAVVASVIAAVIAGIALAI